MSVQTENDEMIEQAGDIFIRHLRKVDESNKEVSQELRKLRKEAKRFSNVSELFGVSTVTSKVLEKSGFFSLKSLSIFTSGVFVGVGCLIGFQYLKDRFSN